MKKPILIGARAALLLLTGALLFGCGKKTPEADQTAGSSGVEDVDQGKDTIIGSDSPGIEDISSSNEGAEGTSQEVADASDGGKTDDGWTEKNSIFDLFRKSEKETAEGEEDEPKAGKGSDKVKKKIKSLGGSSGFYYNQLDERSQKLYREIYEGISCMGTAHLSFLDEELTDEVYELVKADHPELFFCKGYRITWKESFSKITDVELWGDYNMTEEQVLKYADLVENKTNQILAYLPSAGGDYAKVKYLHDYIVEHTEYVLEAEESQNILSVLLEGKSVCSGYTRTLQFLLCRVGIDTAYVWGTASGFTSADSQPHSWNLVLADGQWYCMDVTFDDPTVNMADGTKNMMQYNYFLITSEEIGRTHKADLPQYVPVCTATADNYFVKEGLILETYDPIRLQVLFDQALAGGDQTISFRCKTAAVYEEVKQKLVTEQEMFRYLKGRERISYQNNDDMRTFLFWL